MNNVRDCEKSISITIDPDVSESHCGMEHCVLPNKFPSRIPAFYMVRQTNTKVCTLATRAQPSALHAVMTPIHSMCAYNKCTTSSTDHADCIDRTDTERANHDPNMSSTPHECPRSQNVTA
eukprot:m.25386 g.25386  ORF g.25386 m.25386 type:complete len:121 (-) comp13179_c0_seq1:146-508(-)